MIIKEFEKALEQDWGEFVIDDDFEEGLGEEFQEGGTAAERPARRPVAEAFTALEECWRVLEEEYSISRGAAVVLMVLAGRFPAAVMVKRPGGGSAEYRQFTAGLRELVAAGVLTERKAADGDVYELSHDLLASAAFGEDFAALRAETLSYRASAALLKG